MRFEDTKKIKYFASGVLWDGHGRELIDQMKVKRFFEFYGHFNKPLLTVIHTSAYQTIRYTLESSLNSCLDQCH